MIGKWLLAVLTGLTVLLVETGAMAAAPVKDKEYTLIEPKERGCCGFGGTFRLLNPELSESMTKGKAAAFDGAGLIATSCPNCVFQLNGTIRDRPVRHLLELVGERIGV